nr:MAG TPA: hypothetical protein [Caudoviricetes sp.]
MTEWEILLLVYTGAFGLLMLAYWAWDRMKDMALAIFECRRDIGQLTRDVAVLKMQLDSMAAREVKSLKEER